jgi:DmsE family decaheme c-type cytochrome
MKRSPYFFFLTLLCASALSLGAPRLLRSQPESKYAGDETCQQCHQQQWESFQKSPHGRAAMDGKVVADVVGCESCHGPGAAHAQAAGDKNDPGFATIRNFKKLSADEASAVCAGCHQGGDQFYWKHSDHARNGVGCLNCHSIHRPQNIGGGPMLNAPDVNHMCLTCHIDKRAQLARSGHMPLREGSMTCADCHNPHGSPAEHQLRAATVNELCYKCHADKRGPFLWEHAPVRENCTTCHQPHGSNNDKVLAAKRPYLCQRCHIGTRHPSTLYDNPDLVSNRLFNRSCTNCHSQIHGSNHPSGQFFLR